MGMGYGALKPTNPGTLSNVVFEGLYGIGPTGTVASWHGLSTHHIRNIVVSNVSLAKGNAWDCEFVDNVTLTHVSPSPMGNCAQS